MYKIFRKIRCIYGNLRYRPRFYEAKLKEMELESEGAYFGKLIALSGYCDFKSTLPEKDRRYLEGNDYLAPNKCGFYTRFEKDKQGDPVEVKEIMEKDEKVIRNGKKKKSNKEKAKDRKAKGRPKAK